MRLILFQPDIPQNTGAMIRLAACFGVAVVIVEPAGFVLDDRRLRRAAMDYATHVDLTIARDWQAYQQTRSGRTVLLSTRGEVSLERFAFEHDDDLLLGRESAGVPDEIRAMTDASVSIPLVPAARSLNVTQAAAIALFQGLSQTGGLPGKEG